MADGRRLSLDELVKTGLDQGVAQVEAAGTPLNPFYVSEKGKLYVLVDNVGGVDPMEMALKAIKDQTPDIEGCALVIDTRVTLSDGKKWDAILVMACERTAEEGVLWVQRYVPKGWFRKFRIEGEPEKMGKAKNFISVALAET